MDEIIKVSFCNMLQEMEGEVREILSCVAFQLQILPFDDGVMVGEPHALFHFALICLIFSFFFLFYTVYISGG